MSPMDITLRKIDEPLYRALKARAAIKGHTIGELINEAIRAYIRGSKTVRESRSLRDLRPEPYPKGNERLSEKIDRLLYGG